MQRGPVKRVGRRVLRRGRRIMRARDRVGRSVEPLSRAWGYDRGTPIDRYYLDAFLERHRGDVRGRVLDIGDAQNAARFGAAAERVDVLHYETGHPGATVIGDLEIGEGIPRGAFDCVLLVDTLHVIYDIRSAVRAVHDALKPGGVALVSANGLAAKTLEWDDYWRLTEASMRRLLGEAFGPDQVEVSVYGNVLSATGYLYGLAAQELTLAELDHRDRLLEVSICGRAVRA